MPRWEVPKSANANRHSGGSRLGESGPLVGVRFDTLTVMAIAPQSALPPPMALERRLQRRRAATDWTLFLVGAAILGWLIYLGATSMGYQWQWYRVGRYFYRIIDGITYLIRALDERKSAHRKLGGSSKLPSQKLEQGEFGFFWPLKFFIKLTINRTGL